MKYIINLINIPNQSGSCNLTDDNGLVYAVDYSIRTLPDGNILMDISVNDEVQRQGVICANMMPLVPTNILNGNLYFRDIYGNENPNYNEYNTRFQLIYDTEFRLG